MIGVWRYQLTFLYCIPITWYLVKKTPKRNNGNEIRPLNTAYTWTTFKEIVIAALFFWVASALFITSSRETIYSHTFSLANSGGIFMILMNIVRRVAVNRYEIAGTLVVIISIIILITDSGSSKAGDTNILKGDLLALCAMPCYAFAFIFNSKATKKLPSFIIFHCFSVVQFLVFLIYILIFNSIKMETLFSRDPLNGIFGWSDSHWVLLSTLIITPIWGLIGVGSFIFLLDFFPAHIVAGLFLMEPFTGQMLGCLLGQDHLPSFITIVGASLISWGLCLTIKGNMVKQKEEIEKDSELELSVDSLLI